MHACLEHELMLKARASLFLRARACPEHVLALWGYSHSRGTRLSAHTLDTTESSLSAKPCNAPAAPYHCVCVHAMFSQEPVEPNRRMPYAASYAWAKPASLWSANHATPTHIPRLVAPSPLSHLVYLHTHTHPLAVSSLPVCVAKARRTAPGVHHRDERAAGNGGARGKRPGATVGFQ